MNSSELTRLRGFRRRNVRRIVLIQGEQAAFVETNKTVHKRPRCSGKAIVVKDLDSRLKRRLPHSYTVCGIVGMRSVNVKTGET
jgi:hypothetical protein